jgi:hypothetical protein
MVAAAAAAAAGRGEEAAAAAAAASAAAAAVAGVHRAEAAASSRRARLAVLLQAVLSRDPCRLKGTVEALSEADTCQSVLQGACLQGREA